MAKNKKQDTGSYIPDKPWSEYLDSIRYRYPYTLPTAIEKNYPVVIVDGIRSVVPSGLPRIRQD